MRHRLPKRVGVRQVLRERSVSLEEGSVHLDSHLAQRAPNQTHLIEERAVGLPPRLTLPEGPVERGDDHLVQRRSGSLGGGTQSPVEILRQAKGYPSHDSL